MVSLSRYWYDLPIRPRVLLALQTCASTCLEHFSSLSTSFSCHIGRTRQASCRQRSKCFRSHVKFKTVQFFFSFSAHTRTRRNQEWLMSRMTKPWSVTIRSFEIITSGRVLLRKEGFVDIWYSNLYSLVDIEKRSFLTACVFCLFCSAMIGVFPRLWCLKDSVGWRSLSSFLNYRPTCTCSGKR